MSKVKTAILILSLFAINSYGQNHPFEIQLEPVTIEGLGGLQSYAIGQYNSQWLIVGGRLDGLHRRQPWASFDLAGHNDQLWVIDPATMQKWTAPLTSLPTSIQEQLRSTNMEFYQEGEYLYCLGGYGYSDIIDDHTTFNKLTAIHVARVIDAIKAGNDFQEHFRQITDTEFQVTGGKLKKINNIYHLLGGQKFIGRYNPMGPDHGPGFIQEYTNEVRRFELEDDGTSIEINHLSAFADTINLHRRDYNAESQILPNGNEGITMFSGVFQHEVDLPFLNAVTINEIGYEVDDSFEQLFNHYHCPVVSTYSEKANEMHSIFFGGIAQFYMQQGMMVQDLNVPFVKTISRVTRNETGKLEEHILPIEMPDFLGAGAEFIPLQNIEKFNNGVINLDKLSTDFTLIGYIYGGIKSSQENIFFINDGTQSVANQHLFKVHMKRKLISGVTELVEGIELNLSLYPNPYNSKLNVSFDLEKDDDVTITIRSLNGAYIRQFILENQPQGHVNFSKQIDNLYAGGGVYAVTVKTSTTKRTQQLIME